MRLGGSSDLPVSAIVPTLIALALVSCGPGSDAYIRGQRIPIVDDPAWRVWEFSLSPDGSRAAVAVRSHFKEPAFRLFALDLRTNSVREIVPSQDATAQLLLESRPGLNAAEWTREGVTLRFPAGCVSPSQLWPNFETGGTVVQAGVTVGSRAWFTVNLAREGPLSLELDNSATALSIPRQEPDSVDPRLGLHTTSKQRFDILDLERSGASFRMHGGVMHIELLSATISADGRWIGAVISREASFSSPSRGFLIERATGRLTLLGDGIVSLLRFHPTRHEVYGVSEGISDSTELVRWRY